MNSDTSVTTVDSGIESCETSDLLVFSHLRWDFVFQRPQHLLLRHAKHRRVFYFEEPIIGTLDKPYLHIKDSEHGVRVVVPYLPEKLDHAEHEGALRALVDELIEDEGLSEFTVWYYTPMALPFSRHLQPTAVIYDCMDELSLFKGAPRSLLSNEAELLRRADLVFTGGQSLYEAKRHLHHNIHPFPSSIDGQHFAQARGWKIEPDDQKTLPGPRLGFYGVIDERTDIELLDSVAKLRPDWQFIMIGPVVKIDPESLPLRPNIHYLGKKSYAELPMYLAGWDVAMMPFALNDSTRFISPTKTPEFLAAGRPVVSTAIRDVVHPYETEGLVFIARSPEEFVEHAEHALTLRGDQAWVSKIDAFLSNLSWDKTWSKMAALESAVYQSRLETNISAIMAERLENGLSL